MEKLKVSAVSFGLALGVLWGASVFALALMAYLFSFSEGIVAFVGNMYIDYPLSFTGSIIRGLIGFFDGFLAGLILSWLYNFFVSHSFKQEAKKTDH